MQDRELQHQLVSIVRNAVGLASGTLSNAVPARFISEADLLSWPRCGQADHRLLGGLRASSLEDLPVMPANMIQLHDGLTRPGCEQRLASEAVDRTASV